MQYMIVAVLVDWNDLQLKKLKFIFEVKLN